MVIRIWNGYDSYQVLFGLADGPKKTIYLSVFRCFGISMYPFFRGIVEKLISNKLSAFVATILYSFLPVLTGMVSVTAAGFVVGPTSMPCLLSTLKDEKLTEPLMETNEVRWFLLSLFTKARV